MIDRTEFMLDFSEIRMSDLARVDGKNASLGEMFNALKPKEVWVPDGFATTAARRATTIRATRKALRCVRFLQT
jgi:pyruvate,water dikinase